MREGVLVRRGKRRTVVTMRDDTNIVANRIQDDYERGCKWAAITFVLTFGPMIGLGIYWGWI